jgi:hypothetical protein
VGAFREWEREGTRGGEPEEKEGGVNSVPFGSGGRGEVGAWPAASVTREGEETVGGDGADRWAPPVRGEKVRGG